MDDLARELILDYCRNPRNRGRLPDPTISHEEKNPTCGDVIRMELQVEDDRVKAIRFDGQGCSISQAAASMLTEMVEGKSLEEVRRISKEDILDALGLERLGPSRIKCALLGLKVLKTGVYGIHGWHEDEDEL